MGEPVDTIEINSSVQMIEYEYAKVPIFGSLLDGNINYYQKGEDNFIEFHWYVNVNATGDVFSSIQGPGHGLFTDMTCADVPLDTGKLPSVIGVWVYFAGNQTYEGCKESVPSNSNLDTCIYNVTHTS